MLQGIRDELVDNQTKGNGSLVGETQWGKGHLNLNTFFALIQTAA